MNLEEYKKLVPKYSKMSVTEHATVTRSMGCEHLMRDIIINLADYNNDIPKKYRDKAYDFAYMKGHGTGVHEVHALMVDLVEIFRV